jgi:hypothetical protein
VSGERDLGLDLACIGIKDVAKAPGAPLNSLATYEMANLTHGSHSFDYLGPLAGITGQLVPIRSDFCSFSVTGHELTALFGRFLFHQRLAFTPS